MNIIQIIKFYFKQLLCDHSWRYWNVRLHSDRSGVNGTILPRWRKCDKCHKQQQKRISGWVKSIKTLPDDNDTIDVDVRIVGEPETKQEKRDRLINNILKK